MGCEEAVEVAETYLRDADPKFAEALQTLGKLYNKQGKWDQALAVLEKSVKSRHLGGDTMSWMVAKAESEMSIALRKLGDNIQSFQHIAKALPLFIDSLGPASWRVGWCLVLQAWCFVELE